MHQNIVYDVVQIYEEPSNIQSGGPCLCCKKATKKNMRVMGGIPSKKMAQDVKTDSKSMRTFVKYWSQVFFLKLKKHD